MLETLKYAQENKKMLCVYTNIDDPEKFAAGFIQKVSDDHVLINHLDTFGHYDGYIVKNIEDIFLIEENNKYISNLQKLYSINGKSHDVIEDTHENLLYLLLNYALKRKIVTIELKNSGLDDVRGIVMELKQENVLIENINEYGEKNGLSHIRIFDISHLTCDSQEEQAIMLLMQ